MSRRFAIILAVMVLAGSFLLAQVGPAPGPAPQGASIRIDTPRAGDKLNTSYVTVHFELLNEGAAGNIPNFRVQLDSRDPVTTTSTDQTFTGLRPGNHVVRVQLVDANGTPLPGGSSEVQFTVVPSPNTPGSSSLIQGYHDAALLDPSDPASLPSSGSELPLLSVIGFGVLLGGIISAMRTR